jgi:hypothetical protein
VPLLARSGGGVEADRGRQRHRDEGSSYRVSVASRDLRLGPSFKLWVR